MATWLYLVALSSITVSIFSNKQLIAPASAAPHGGGGGPWNPPLPRSRGGFSPTPQSRPHPRKPRQFDKYFGEQHGGAAGNEDYPVRQTDHGRKHRVHDQDAAPRPSYNRVQPSYSAYPKFIRRASSRAANGDSIRYKFENIHVPGPDDMPDAQSSKPARLRKPVTPDRRN